MIQLPPGFDVSALFSDFVQVALPIVGCAVLISCFVVIAKTLKNL